MNQRTRERIQEIAQQRADLIAQLKSNPEGMAWCEAHTRLADEVVHWLYRDATEGGNASFSVIATGGYGRRELAPYSDIDITVVPEDEHSSALDAAIRAFFQDLHWAFGTTLRMGVGYAYRLVADAPGLDAKTRTGLLDARLIAGPRSLFDQLEQRVTETMAVGQFLLAKIQERDQACEKHNATPLVVEPNLKEGAGGLRSFQAANWLRTAIGERSAKPGPSYELILKVRNVLHAVAGRQQDLLSRQRQPDIAEILNRDLYSFLSDVASAGMDLHRLYLDTKEKLRESRFPLSHGVLALRGEARFSGPIDAGEAAVGVSVATALGLAVSDIAPETQPRVSGAAALYAISRGEPTLRNLDRCGLLAKLLPELTACRTLMPEDTVHVYSVFEHTLQVVRLLDSVPEESYLHEIRSALNDLEPLYLAVLLHDVGKIDPSRPHSEVGAEVADHVCARWELAPGSADLVRWLIAEHLTMARFIGLRDLTQPQTIDEFRQIVGTERRLRMLTLLTWADVHAVSPDAWTAAQETFLRQLYVQTLHALEGDSPSAPDPALQRRRLLKQLKKDVPEAALQGFIESLPAHYLGTASTELVRLHFGLAQRAQKGEPTVEVFHQQALSATDFTVCAPDQPGLLSKLLGAFYAFDLSVLGIRASTTTTDNPVAIDVFTVSFGGRPVPSATSAQLTTSILALVKGEQSVEELLAERGKDPIRMQNWFTYTYIPGSLGVLELRAPRGRGMAYRFSRLLAEQGWNIASARVGQWADSAAATFYITGPNSEPLSRERVEAVLGQRPSPAEAGRG
jgi:[protein-PII] uridylyltransferase